VFNKYSDGDLQQRRSCWSTRLLKYEKIPRETQLKAELLQNDPIYVKVVEDLIMIFLESGL